MPDRGETAAQRLSADGVIALGRLRRGRWRFGQAEQRYPRIESDIEDANARLGPRAAATTAFEGITRRARGEQLKAPPPPAFAGNGKPRRGRTGDTRFHHQPPRRHHNEPP